MDGYTTIRKHKKSWTITKGFRELKQKWDTSIWWCCCTNGSQTEDVTYVGSRQPFIVAQDALHLHCWNNVVTCGPDHLWMCFKWVYLNAPSNMSWVHLHPHKTVCLWLDPLWWILIPSVNRVKESFLLFQLLRCFGSLPPDHWTKQGNTNLKREKSEFDYKNVS